MNIENFRSTDYDQVLLSLYSAVSEPDHFWSVLGLLSRYDDEEDVAIGEVMQQHAERMHDLLEDMIKLSRHAGDDAQDWEVQFKSTGRISFFGLRLQELLKVEEPEDVWGLPLLPRDVARLKRHMKSGASQPLILILPSLDGAASHVAEVLTSDYETFTLKPIELTLAGPAERVFHESFDVSNAQFRVLECLVAGLSVSEIAERLDRSVETVRSHIKALSQKLGVRSQPELVSRALSVPVSEETTSRREGFVDSSTVLDIAGQRVQFVDAGDPNGRPVLFFQHATEGPFITHALQRALKIEGIRLISIARPGAGSTDRKAGEGGGYADVSARLHHRLVDHLGLKVTVLLSVSTGLPHALAYAKQFCPHATILALNPFPPFLTKEDFRGLPGRWSTYSSVTSRTPFLVKTLVLLAWRLFKKNPDEHVRKMVKDDFPDEVEPVLLADIRSTLKRNMTLNAENQVRHYVDEANLLSSDWASPASKQVPDVNLHLVQGSGHFTIPQAALERLAGVLPNATLETVERRIDPLHALNPEGVAERLSRLLSEAIRS